MKRNGVIKLKDIGVFLLIVGCIFVSFYIQFVSLIGMLIGIIYIFSKTTHSNIYCMLLFLFPFAGVFKIFQVSTSLFTVLELVFIGKLLLSKQKISMRYFSNVVFFAFYCFFVSIISGNIGIFDILKIFMNLTLLFVFIKSYEEIDLVAYSLYYCMGLSIASIMGLFKQRIPGFMAMYSDINSQYINGARVIRFSGTFNDPNYYSIAVVVGLGLVMCVFIRGVGNKILALLGVLLAIFGLYTYSKSYFLILLILAVIAVGLMIKNGNIGWLTVSAVIVAVIIASGVLSQVTMIQTILSRFDGITDKASLTSNRTLIWENYMAYITGNIRVFFFGDGLGAPYIVGAAHNLYVEIWYYIGITGIVIYFITLMRILGQRSILRRKSILNYYLLAIVALMYFFLAGFTAYEFPYYMMICWIVLNTDLRKSKHVEGVLCR